MLGFPHTLVRKIGLLLLVILFLLTGSNHFQDPNFYVSIMPPYLPLRYELSQITGFFEIIGAIGILFARTRRLAGCGLMLLLIAIFPANIHMALNAVNFPHYSATYLYLRLPVQLIFIIWIYWATVQKKAIGHHERY